jgi:RNA polymerase sigma-70 factor, ECF subfamily
LQGEVDRLRQREVQGEPIESKPIEIAALLARCREGDQQAIAWLTPLIYDNLRQIAKRYMVGEKKDHTLSPTALVHEAYLRLFGSEISWQDKAHFLAIAAREMRRILVDYARSTNRQKRGGKCQKVELFDFDHPVENVAISILAIDEVLGRLRALDERKAEIIDLTVFGGLTAVEAAKVIGVSEVTIRREWRMAKAWLQHELRGGTS